MKTKNVPKILQEFLVYHETIKGHSRKTVNEYYLDLRNFLRFAKKIHCPETAKFKLEDIDIADIDLQFISGISLSDIYDYMSYLSRERACHPNSRTTAYGIGPAARARKIAAIRSFYNYLTNKTHQLRENPLKDIDSPKIKKTLPVFLSLEESLQLLNNVKGLYKERDYCILTLFLNCGLRISELVALNLSDIQQDTIRVLGKGNKVRILFLSESCQNAIQQYLAIRSSMKDANKEALFLSSRKERISRSTVHSLVKKHLEAAGIDSTQYSAHKLRHTAATLMLKNGVDVRALQEVLGHDHLNTTEIYTHVDNESLRIAAQASPLSRIHQKERKSSGIK